MRRRNVSFLLHLHQKLQYAQASFMCALCVIMKQTRARCIAALYIMHKKKQCVIFFRLPSSMFSDGGSCELSKPRILEIFFSYLKTAFPFFSCSLSPGFFVLFCTVLMQQTKSPFTVYLGKCNHSLSTAFIVIGEGMQIY